MTPAIVRCLAAAALVAGAGCAVQPPAPEVKPQATTTGTETDERARARIHTELAAGYFSLGNLSVALEEAAIALRADANYGPAHNIAGLVYGALKEDRLAEHHFAQALRINPLDSDANNNYGWYLCQRRREEEGLKYLMAALRNPLYENADRTYINAGLCAGQRGDFESAGQYFQSALKVRPNHPQALFHLTRIAFERGDYAAAKNYLDRLTQLVALNAEALWLGVRIARKLNDRESESSYAAQLRNRFPESRETQALLSGRYE